MHPRQLMPGSAATVVGITGTVVALVWTYSVMRVVMASLGNSTDTRLLEASIFGGMICLVLYAAFGLSAGPRLTLLAWPALFLSQGWIFVADARHPPALAVGDNSGVWWADGILFAVLGCAVLIPLLVVPKGRRLLWSDGTDGPTIDVLLRRQRPRQPRNIDELFPGLTAQRRPAAVGAGQVYSVVLHALVITLALWLGVASFGWLTRS